MGLPSDIVRHTERHGSVISFAELVALGYGRGQIASWVRRGLLVRRHRGVYAIPGAPVAGWGSHRAALLRVGERGCLAGASALALFDAEGFDLTQLTPTVAVPPGRTVTRVEFAVRQLPLDSPDKAVVRGLRTSRVEHGLVEAAAHEDEKTIRVAGDDLRRRGLLRLDRLERVAHRLTGFTPGAEAVLAMLDRGTFDQESEGERNLAGVFLPTDPQPLWQVYLLPHRRVDACFLEARLVLESLSRTWHGTDGDRQRDAARTHELQREAGVHVVEVWPSEVDDNPSLVRQRVLNARAEQLRAGVRPMHPRELPPQR
jgi:hypothetical protein